MQFFYPLAQEFSSWTCFVFDFLIKNIPYAFKKDRNIGSEFFQMIKAIKPIEIDEPIKAYKAELKIIGPYDIREGSLMYSFYMNTVHFHQYHSF